MMTTTPTQPESSLARGLRAASTGGKLLMVMLLALFMSLATLFIDSLVDERAKLHAVPVVSSAPLANVSAAPQLVPTAPAYQSLTRSLKYAPLFLGLVFLTYFLFEVSTGCRLHLAQYLLVGFAQTIFYLLLLSIAELAGFDWAFLIAGFATVALLSVNVFWVFRSGVQAFRAAGVFGALYTLIFLLLRLQNYALLLGSVGSFVAVTAAMYVTRRIDWFGTGQRLDGPFSAGSGGFRVGEL